MILAGGVRVNGAIVNKPSFDIVVSDRVAAEPPHPFVGRGGVKLDHAFTIWPLDVAQKTCVDLGASTGGFVDVLLRRGAGLVYAIDVGTGQLDARLRADPRVRLFERLDARVAPTVIDFSDVNFLTADLSFISLAKALGPALQAAPPGADLVALIKPQFELGPTAIGKGGLVPEALAPQALDLIAAFIAATPPWIVQATAESPIAGGDGNREFLLWARKGAGENAI